MSDRSDRDAYRRRRLAALSPRYSPLLHALCPSVWGLVVLGACAALVRDVTCAELATVPVVLLLSNMSEWRLHRDLLHKRSRLFPALFDQHTPQHHRIYVCEDMQIREWRELKFILIPPWAAVALFVGLIPLATALYFVLSPNVAYLFEATCMVYVVSYELLHLSYHLPVDSFVGRNPVIRALARHHSTHHDPRRMQRFNMNVSLPLWDLVRGTTWRPARDAHGRRDTPAPAVGATPGSG